MNWYKHYMGDYARDTAHLTILQHGIYRLLLDPYYATEKPLQAHIPTLQRIIRATTPDEQDAVKTVLKEYFCLEGEFYIHSRADKELTKYEAQADHNRTVGKLGGRPKNPEITQVVSENNPSGFENITRNKPNPDTRYQIPDNQIPETKEREVDKPPRSPKIVSKFEKPTLIEIRTYCEAIGASINPVTFFNHYETVGWKVGKNPMKDWKAAIRGWNSRDAK